MKLALLRALLFAATAVAVIVVWEVLTFELPREPVSEVWKQRAWLHALVVLGSAVATFVGAVAGFKMVPADRALTKWRVAVVGGLFALPAFSLLVLTAESASPVGGFVALAVVAAVVAFVGGRLLSRHAA
jgi:hypothetical protein